MIAEALAYIDARSPLNDKRWIRELYRCIHSLSTLPARCGIAPEADLLGRELRHYIYKSHRIVYEIKGTTVNVLFLVHGARRPIGEEPDSDPPLANSN